VVSGIAPGAFPSARNKGARDHADAVGRRIPSGRVGDAADIAGGAVYLASRAGDYVVGTTLPIDGGLVNADLPADFLDPLGT
jgi:NAD(P)-dependent dehydrogenase (short-subunit alcohol dehydrogenase family)